MQSDGDHLPANQPVTMSQMIQSVRGPPEDMTAPMMYQDNNGLPQLVQKL